jgi:hypothetical protein
MYCAGGRIGLPICFRAATWHSLDAQVLLRASCGTRTIGVEQMDMLAMLVLIAAMIVGRFALDL